MIVYIDFVTKMLGAPTFNSSCNLDPRAQTPNTGLPDPRPQLENPTTDPRTQECALWA